MVEKWNLGDAPKKAKGELLTFDPKKRQPRSAAEEFHRKRNTSPPAVVDLGRKKKEREEKPRRAARRIAKEVLTDLADKTGFEIVDDTDKRLVEKAARRMALMARDMTELNGMQKPDYEKTWEVYVANVQRALGNARAKVGSKTLHKMSADIAQAIANCVAEDKRVMVDLQGSGFFSEPAERILWRLGLMKHHPDKVADLKKYRRFLEMSHAHLRKLHSLVSSAADIVERQEQHLAHSGEES